MKRHPPLKFLSVLTALLALSLGSASAGAVLNITPITWNVLGLDSNNVNVGPNQYPVGARVCNVGDSTATNVTAKVFFDGGTTNTALSIYGATTLQVASLPAGSAPPSPYTVLNVPANCTDFYFTVQVARVNTAYSSRVSDTATPAQRNTQLFHIEAYADGTGPVSTPPNRELYVEKLISQSRNAVLGFSGPTNVVVGQTYTYTLDATTAPGGYEQLEVYPNFPNTMFQVLNVSSTYSTPTGAVNSTVYADACGWENNRTSLSYHNNLTCIGPQYYAGGKAGDVTHTEMTVKVLSAGTATVQTLINDYSGSSYHYNADFGSGISSKTITATLPVNTTDLTITKTHTAMSLGSSSGVYSLTVSNIGGTASTGLVTVTDTLPSEIKPTAASGNGWTCSVVGQTVTCTRLDPLAAKASYPVINIATTVTTNKAGLVVNTATVSGGGDTVSNNNSADDPTNITAQVNLGITKVQSSPAAGTPVPAGSEVTYTITVTNPNQGSSDANGAVLTDPLIDGFTVTNVTCTNNSGNKAECPASMTPAQLQTGLTIPKLLNGSSLTFTVTGTANGTFAGSVTNTAYIEPPSGFSDTNTTNNVASATTTVTLPRVSGRLYEDFNYGGGAGRAFNAAQGMSLRPGARIEVYDASGNFKASTVTDSLGAFSVGVPANATYNVRVVNGTVTSVRNPAASGLIPVQTYGANQSKVGGSVPALTDAPAGASGTTLASLTTGTTTAQTVRDVSVVTSSVSVPDFGFNFDTVVNTNASGQGSLAQFILNSNALPQSWTGGSLAQSGQRSRDGVAESLPAGTESSIFMIPSSALTGGVAIISIPDGATSSTSVLPAVTDTRTSIDGTTQTVNIGDNNPGSLGTGGNVGYLTTQTLTQVPRPEVEVRGTGSGTVTTTAGYGLILNANNTTLRGVSMRGFGGNNDSQGLVFVKSAADVLLEQNYLGFSAASAALCQATSPATSVGSGVWSQNSVRGTLIHNLLSCNGGNGAHIHTGTSNWMVTNNEFRANALNTSNLDGLNLASGSSGNTVRGNLFTDNNANGTDTYAGGGGNLFESNTITHNGQGGAGEVPGMRLYSKNNTVRFNVIQDNYGSGILVVNTDISGTDALTGNLISKNSISGNGTILSKTGATPSGQIGIDLTLSSEVNSASSGLVPYVTPNDMDDSDTGGNGGMNFPVFDTAIVDGTNAYLTGWARPGSTIELFIAAPDPGGFGEGQTYLTTLVEGSAADTDTGSSTYTDRVIGRIAGQATRTGTDTTNRFRFVIPLSSLSGVTVNTSLTATATDAASNTSEFSPWVTMGTKPSVTLLKYVRNTSVSGQKFSKDGSTGLPGATLQYCITFTNTGGFAPNFKVQDYVPANTTLLPGSLIYSAPASDLTTLSTSPTSLPLPGSASLSQTGSGPVIFTTNASGTLPASGLAANSSGMICFNATIK